jgi:hypothetical protein
LVSIDGGCTHRQTPQGSKVIMIYPSSDSWVPWPRADAFRAEKID